MSYRKSRKTQSSALLVKNYRIFPDADRLPPLDLESPSAPSFQTGYRHYSSAYPSGLF